MRRLRFVAVAVGALMAGCAVTPTKPVKAPVRVTPAAAVKEQMFYHVLIGDIAGQQGHLGEAAAAFGAAAQESGNLGLARRSALLALYARHYRLGERLARAWRKADPHNPEAWEAVADGELGQAQIAAAERNFEHALALVTTQEGASGRAFAFENMAALIGRNPSGSKIVAVMQAVSDHYPSDPIGRYVLADLARDRGHLRTAKRAVNAALRLQPHWEDAAILKARLLWTNAPLASLSFARQFLAANPDATRLRLDYARRLVSLQYWRKALVQFQAVANATPNDPQVLYATGLVALKSRQLAMAERYLRRVVALDPTDAHARLYLGEIAERAHHYRAAAYWYRDVGGAYRFGAQVRLALLPFQQHHPRESLRELRRLVARSERQRITLALTRNRVLVSLGQITAGVRVLTATMHHASHVSALLFARAVDEARLKDTKAAIADFEALVAQRPDDPVALNALGYALVSNHLDEHRGLRLARRALALDPGNPDILDSVGWAYYQLGKPAVALSYLHRAYTRSHDGTIAAHLGRVLWALGDHRAAHTLWRRAARRHPRNGHLQRALETHRL